MAANKRIHFSVIHSNNSHVCLTYHALLTALTLVIYVYISGVGTLNYLLSLGGTQTPQLLFSFPGIVSE